MLSIADHFDYSIQFRISINFKSFTQSNFDIKPQLFVYFNYIHLFPIRTESEFFQDLFASKYAALQRQLLIVWSYQSMQHCLRQLAQALQSEFFSPQLVNCNLLIVLKIFDFHLFIVWFSLRFLTPAQFLSLDGFFRAAIVKLSALYFTLPKLVIAIKIKFHSNLFRFLVIQFMIWDFLHFNHFAIFENQSQNLEYLPSQFKISVQYLFSRGYFCNPQLTLKAFQFQHEVHHSFTSIISKFPFLILFFEQCWSYFKFLLATTLALLSFDLQ